MTNDELLHKWVNNDISEEELKIFKLRPEYESLTDLAQVTDGLVTPELDGETMLATILTTPKDLPLRKPKTKTLFPSWMKYGIAAAIVVLVGYFAGILPNSDNNRVNYEIAAGQSMEGTLPDMSTFSLKDGSKLSYDKESWATNRTVTLEGEAFFKVEKGSTFSVVTALGMVEVLGTEFNVNSKGQTFAVSCKEGHVAVRSELSDNYKEELFAGESALINSTGASKTFKIDVTKMRKVTLSDVTEELAKKYNLKWEVADIEMNTKLTCNFKHDNLETALKTSLGSLDIDYELLSGSVVRLKKG